MLPDFVQKLSSEDQLLVDDYIFTQYCVDRNTRGQYLSQIFPKEEVSCAWAVCWMLKVYSRDSLNFWKIRAGKTLSRHSVYRILNVPSALIVACWFRGDTNSNVQTIRNGAIYRVVTIFARLNVSVNILAGVAVIVMNLYKYFYIHLFLHCLKGLGVY